MPQTQDTFEIYRDERDQINYADTGRLNNTGKGDLFKRCEVPGEPKASYLCGRKGFSCAIKTHKDDKGGVDEGVGCLGSKQILARLFCSQACTAPSHKAVWLIPGGFLPTSLVLAACPTARLLWPSMRFSLHCARAREVN